MKTAQKPSLKALAIRGSMWTLAGHGGCAIDPNGQKPNHDAPAFSRDLRTDDLGLGGAIRPADVRGHRNRYHHYPRRAGRRSFISKHGVHHKCHSGSIALANLVPHCISRRGHLSPTDVGTAAARDRAHGADSRLCSTAMYTRRRHMDFKRLTILDLSNETVTFVVLVIWAYFYRDAWALVGGAVVGQIFLVLASHVYLPGIRNKFRWDQSALNTFMGFGKWIYLSSVVYFLSTQSDRFLLGRYLDMAHLGVYGTATVLSGAVQTIVLKINSDVLFPAYSRVVQEGTGRLRQVVLRTRLAIDAGMILPIAAMLVLGSAIVDLLYDHRYHEAGWMLQVLSVRLLLVATLSNSESCLIALGYPKYSFILNSCRTVAMFISIPIGWSMAGIKGVIWAVALSEIPPLAVVWFGMIKHEMFSIAAESRSLLFAGLGILLGLGVLHFWQ